MPIFDELINHKPLEVPEERQAEDLRRGEAVYNKKAKLKNTSVSADRYFSTMRFAALGGVLIAAVVLGYVILSGVRAFISQ